MKLKTIKAIKSHMCDKLYFSHRRRGADSISKIVIEVES